MPESTITRETVDRPRTTATAIEAPTIVGTEKDDFSIPDVPLDRHADRIGYKGSDFAWIPINQIRVDPVYQRGLNANRVTMIAENFDPAAFGVLLLSLRPDGSKWSLDGQHRVEALRAMYGHDSPIKAPCFLMRNLNQSGEAAIFYKMNRHRLSPTAMDAFKARLAFADPTAVAINDLLRRHGLVIRYGTAAHLKYGEVRAIGEIERIYRSGLLETILDLIAKAWRGEEGAHKALMLRGVATFLDMFHDEFFDDAVSARLRAERYRRLVDTLAAMTPVELERRARHWQQQLNASAGGSVARAIHFNFNRNLRGNARLSPWGEEDVPGQEE